MNKHVLIHQTAIIAAVVLAFVSCRLPSYVAVGLFIYSVFTLQRSRCVICSFVDSLFRVIDCETGHTRGHKFRLTNDHCNYSTRNWASVEYWIHFTALVVVFTRSAINSAESEPIWMKFRALFSTLSGAGPGRFWARSAH